MSVGQRSPASTASHSVIRAAETPFVDKGRSAEPTGPAPSYTRESSSSDTADRSYQFAEPSLFKESDFFRSHESNTTQQSEREQKQVAETEDKPSEEKPAEQSAAAQTLTPRRRLALDRKEAHNSLQSGLKELQLSITAERSKHLHPSMPPSRHRANLFAIDVDKVKNFLRTQHKKAVDSKQSSPEPADTVTTLFRALRHRIGRMMNSSRGEFRWIGVGYSEILLDVSCSVLRTCVGRKRALDGFISADIFDCTQCIGPRRRYLPQLLTHFIPPKTPTQAAATTSQESDSNQLATSRRRMFTEAVRFVNRLTSYERGRRYLLNHPDAVQLLVCSYLV